MHGDKRDNDRDRQRDNDYQGARHMEKKNDDYSTDNEALLNQLFLQSGDRFQDEVRTVIGCDDLYTWRKRGLDHFDFLLDPFDQIERVLAVAHDHDATNNLSFAVELGDTAPHIRPQSHLADVSHKDGRAAVLPPTAIISMSLMDLI